MVARGYRDFRIREQLRAEFGAMSMKLEPMNIEDADGGFLGGYDDPDLENENENAQVIAGLDDSPDAYRWLISVKRMAPGTDMDDANVYRSTDIKTVDSLPEILREKYNGGKFKVLIYRNAKLYKNRTMVIEAPTVSAGSEKSELKTMIEAMERNNQRLIETLTGKKEMAFDPMATVKETIGLAAGLAGLNRQQPQGMTAQDMIALITLGREMSGDSSGGSAGWMETLSKTLNGPLGEAIAKGFMAPAGAVAPGVPRPAPPQPVRPVVQAPGPAPSPETNLQAGYMKFVIDQLLFYAEGKADVVAIADHVLNITPPAMVRDILAQPDPIAALLPAFPRIAEFRPWFEALLNELRAAMDDTSMEGERVATGNGDASPGGTGGGT